MTSTAATARPTIHSVAMGDVLHGDRLFDFANAEVVQAHPFAGNMVRLVLADGGSHSARRFAKVRIIRGGASNARAERAETLRGQAAELAKMLGEALGADVTFGYTGNLSASGPVVDDRSWSVYLPHPGRVGTAADCIGHVATDDVAGWERLIEQVRGAISLARWQAAR